MSDLSPYDLVRKASRAQKASDRWAALQANLKTHADAQQPVRPIPPQDVVFPAQGAENCAPSSAQGTQPRRSQSRPDLIDPPFPPPQPRHSSLDDIALRHTQARKAAAAMPVVTWKKRTRADAPSAPIKEKEPPETP